VPSSESSDVLPLCFSIVVDSYYVYKLANISKGKPVILHGRRQLRVNKYTENNALILGLVGRCRPAGRVFES